MNPVTITRAGGSPPQRGDFFHVDAPIFASGDANGTEIGRYQCFGAWTHAANDAAAADQRFTSVQFHLAGGAIMGIINEGGITKPRTMSELSRAAQGRTPPRSASSNRSLSAVGSQEWPRRDRHQAPELRPRDHRSCIRRLT